MWKIAGFLASTHVITLPTEERISRNWQLLSKIKHASSSILPLQSLQHLTTRPVTCLWSLAGSGIYSDSKRASFMPRVNEVKRPQVRPRVFSKKRSTPLCLEVTQEPHGTDSEDRGWPPTERTLPTTCLLCVPLAPSTHQ